MGYRYYDWNEKINISSFWYLFSIDRIFKKAIYAANENKQFITNNGKELKIFLEVYTGGELQSIKSWTNDTISINKPFAVNVKGKNKFMQYLLMAMSYQKKTYIILISLNKCNSAEIYCANGKRTQYFDYSQDENKITFILKEHHKVHLW
ncbi:hypothetical protein [Klebsiella pneumoniae]|uniref:hypothetical protein n=1 Tax=Klebsiella pneumoniae TaxID=573 RepID=UPI001E51C612|nr:hypothetical protein [Klebsiella pneumoniae]